MIGAITAGLFGVGTAASTNAYESISTVTVGAGGQASITFSSIPSTYKHLQIRATGRSAVGTGQVIVMQFNGDTASNYSSHELSGNGATATASGSASRANIYAAYATSATSLFTGAIIDILDYADTNKYKTTRALGGFDNNGSGNIALFSGNWRSTSAVTSVTLYDSGTNNIAQYSQFALYGIKG